MDPFTGKKVLITGVNGFIGVNLAHGLIRQGAILEGTSRDPKNMPYVQAASLENRFPIHALDVLDAPAVARLIKKGAYDYVFHLASQSDPRKSVQHPYETIQVNILGTLNLLEAIRLNEKKPKIVLAGTVRAFYNPGEDDSKVGLHPYDASKMGMESIAKSYFNACGITGAVAKNTNVFGENDLNFTRLIPTIMKQAFTEGTIRLKGDGKLKRDFMYVGDAVKGMLTLASKLDDPRVKGQSFTFATGKLLMVRDVCATVQGVLKEKVSVEFDESKAFVERNQPALDVSQTKSVLEWTSTTSLEQGMRATSAWYENYFRRNP